MHVFKKGEIILYQESLVQDSSKTWPKEKQILISQLSKDSFKRMQNLDADVS